MDLGISGRRALVCGSSQGLGFACAAALAREGAHVILNGRSAEKLEAAVGRLSLPPGVSARYVAADLTTEDGRRAVAAAAPQIDILVTNIAGPRPGALADWDHAAWLGAFEATRCKCWIRRARHHVTRTPALPLMVIRCSPAIEPK